MSKIKQAEARANFPVLEEKIHKFWEDNDIFQKSIDQRPDDNRYSFVDGPPFVSGMPHPAHLFVSVAKDVIPRYWTMRGKKVRRVFGWDCHGLPIETKVNQRHNLKGRAQIEQEFGVDNYVRECRKYVEEFTENWRWYIEKIGRWADMDNAYYTMYPEFNESVIWAFKQAWDKGLIYKGKRVSLYSTDTATPVSNFEVAMDPDNYQDVEDLSIYVNFELEENKWEEDTNGKPVNMLAWTTTPWTIPANFAISINPNFDYVLVEFEGAYYIMTEARLQYAFDVNSSDVGETDDHKVRILRNVKPTEIEGMKYKPVFDFFVKEASENDFKVYLHDEVTDEEGTGVLHLAPAFGEVDFIFGQKHGISGLSNIDEEGNLTVGDWKGVYVRDASPLVAKQMAEDGTLFREEKYVHRLPFFRGKNPLIYMAQDAYFLDVQKIKDRMLELNQDVNWIPEHYKEGRFAHAVSTAPDWTISRSRYWATIMPLWVSEDGEELVIESIEDLMKYTEQIEKREVDGKTKYFVAEQPFSFHRDVCDKLILNKDGKQFKRVPEVLDCWMDSGSVPFAEYHYPFENQEEFKNAFPCDFVVEYSGQVRAWFNVLFRMAVINFDQIPFKNVLCHGVMSGNDGRKMSKTYGNYTDPEDVLKDIGGEAFRLYAMGSPLMGGGDMNWSDEELTERIKTILIPFWNTYRYLTMYAEQNDWTPENTEFPENNVLDRWLKSFLNKQAEEYSNALEAYDLPGSVKVLQPTIDGVSTWWIRRSRDRFAKGDPEALQTLYAAVVYMSKVFAPQLAFLMEEVYQTLVVDVGLKEAKESVHLELYPEKFEYDDELLEDMDLLRAVCSIGLNIRDDKRLKLRQPLSKAYTALDNDELTSLLKDELNVKMVEVSEKPVEGKTLVTQELDGKYVTLDVELTDELAEEGSLNELARHIQVLRKNVGLLVEDKVSLSYSTESEPLEDVFGKYEKELKERVGLTEIEKVEDASGENSKTFSVKEEEVTLQITK